MRVVLPENHKDITLGQYQDYIKLMGRDDLSEFDLIKRKVKIFTGVPYVKVALMKIADLKEINKQIETALNADAMFQNRFKMGDVEFGFITNFDDIQAKEWFDLTTYDTKIETLHNLMAILFRPIKKTDSFENYSIAKYEGSKEWAEAMKATPLNIVNGALFFFKSLQSELETYIRRSTKLEQAKATKLKATLKSGDGLQRLINWLKVGRGNMNLSKT